MQVVIVQSMQLFDTYCMFLVTSSFMATYKKPYLKSELCVCVCLFYMVLCTMIGVLLVTLFLKTSNLVSQDSQPMFEIDERSYLCIGFLTILQKETLMPNIIPNPMTNSIYENISFCTPRSW